MTSAFFIKPEEVAVVIDEAWSQRTDALPPESARKCWFKPDPNVIVLTAVRRK